MGWINDMWTTRTAHSLEVDPHDVLCAKSVNPEAHCQDCSEKGKCGCLNCTNAEGGWLSSQQEPDDTPDRSDAGLLDQVSDY